MNSKTFYDKTIQPTQENPEAGGGVIFRTGREKQADSLAAGDLGVLRQDFFELLLGVAQIIGLPEFAFLALLAKLRSIEGLRHGGKVAEIPGFEFPADNADQGPGLAITASIFSITPAASAPSPS